MFCSECGAKLKNGDRFCGECGAKVTQESKKVIHENKKESSKKQVKKERQHKKLSKGKKIGLGIILVLLVVVIGGYAYLAHHFSPSEVATEYLEALISQDVERIYHSLDLDKSNSFVSLDNFKKVYDESSTELDEVINYQLQEIDYSDEKLSANVSFRITTKTDEETVTIRVVKTTKKEWLIFDSWEVANSRNSYVVTDYQISVPKGASVTIGDTALEEKYLNSEKTTNLLDVYTIPQIFIGDYTITSTLANGMTISEEVNISSYNTSYQAQLDVEDLSDETTKALEEQITKDINALYANIIAKKKWDDVKGSYSYGNTNLDELQDVYEDLYDELVTDGEVALTKFTVTNVDLVDVSLEDGRFEVVVKFNYDYSINYTNYAGEAATKDGSSSNRTTLVYDYFEDTYKIYDIDGTVTYFSTW